MLSVSEWSAIMTNECCGCQIRALDPLHMHNMDLYAFLLSRDKRTKDLQT